MLLMVVKQLYWKLKMLKDEDRIFKNLYNDLGWEIDCAISRGDWSETKNIIEEQYRNISIPYSRNSSYILWYNRMHSVWITMKRLLYILIALTVLQIGLHLTEIIIDINTHIVHLL